jgi:hypothetical protein
MFWQGEISFRLGIGNLPTEEKSNSRSMHPSGRTRWKDDDFGAVRTVLVQKHSTKPASNGPGGNSR